MPSPRTQWTCFTRVAAPPDRMLAWRVIVPLLHRESEILERTFAHASEDATRNVVREEIARLDVLFAAAWGSWQAGAAVAAQ